MYKRIDGLLAWIWLACLLLTLADWFSPLEITSQSLKAGVHCSIWLLVYPMSRHFNILDTGLAKMMWRGLIIGSLIACVLAFISVVAWPLIGVLAPPAVAEYLFFSGNGRGWRPDYVYFQRGSSLMLRQREGSTGWRDIQVTPITPFFQWAVPLMHSGLSLAWLPLTNRGETECWRCQRKYLHNSRASNRARCVPTRQEYEW